MPTRGLVILDRDGVINHDSAEFVKSAEEWRPIDGSIQAIADLSTAGFSVAIASNQSGLARGLFGFDDLGLMHEKLHRLVAAEGGHIDHVIVCPHGPDDDCDCRKPKPGMLLELAGLFETTLDEVPFIGDSLRDLETAVAAGARPMLVRTGNGAEAESSLTGALTNVEVFDDLAAAAAALINS